MKVSLIMKSTFILLLTLTACSKKDSGSNGNVKDTSAPVITIITPASNQQFSAGQTIQVSATATDNVKLTELHIHVIDKASGSLLRDIHSYPNALSGTVADGFTAQAGIGYTIKIIAIDPSQNLSTSQVDVSVN